MREASILAGYEINTMFRLLKLIDEYFQGLSIWVYGVLDEQRNNKSGGVCHEFIIHIRVSLSLLQ